MEKLYKNKEWLEDKIKTIGNLTTIGDMCGVSNDTIEYWRRKLGIEKHIVINRINTVDENFFANIDTEEKAYWLGFIMADGCISTSNKRTPNNRLHIILKQDDIDHLYKFKDDIQFSGEVKRGEIHDKRGFTTYKAEIKINSKQLCSDLMALGVVSRKTGKEKIPSEIPDDLIRHFCRGFFDGDGSIAYIYKAKQYRFKLGSSSELILKQFQELLKKIGVDEVHYYLESQYKVPFYILETSHKKKINSIFHWLYDDASVYLDRKYNRAMCMFQNCPPEQ